jgi:hypothetical protein
MVARVWEETEHGGGDASRAAARAGGSEEGGGAERQRWPMAAPGVEAAGGGASEWSGARANREGSFSSLTRLGIGCGLAGIFCPTDTSGRRKWTVQVASDQWDL